MPSTPQKQDPFQSYGSGKTKLDSTRIVRKGFQTAPRGAGRPAAIPPVDIKMFQDQQLSITAAQIKR